MDGCLKSDEEGFGLEVDEDERRKKKTMGEESILIQARILSETRKGDIHYISN